MQIPIEMGIRTCCDEGLPIVISSPDSASAKHYIDVAQKVIKRLEELSQKQFRPEISLWFQEFASFDKRKIQVLTLCAFVDEGDYRPCQVVCFV